MRRRALLVLAFWLQLSATALAEGPANSGRARSPEAAYDDAIKDAVSEFDRGNWPEAYAFFRRAHELQPSARTLRGMGISAYEMRRYVRTIELLEAALATDLRPLGARQRHEVEELIQRARRFVAEYQVQVAPSEARLTLDGEPVKLGISGALLLDPGEYELVVAADGYEGRSQRIMVNPGAHGALTLQLSPANTDPATPAVSVRVPPAAPNDAAAAPSPKPSVGSGHSGLWWGGLGAGVGTLAFAGVGVFAVLQSNAAFEKVQDRCAHGCLDSEIDRSQVTTYDRLAWTSWALAGAGAVTAVTLFTLAARRAQAEARDPRAHLSVGPFSAVLRGQF